MINPYRVEKALLKSHKGQIIVDKWKKDGNFILKVERWNVKKIEADWVARYGGWVKIRSLPFPWWLKIIVYCF